MILRNTNKPAIIVALCALVMMRVMDFAVFDVNDDHHNVSNQEMQTLELSHETQEDHDEAFGSEMHVVFHSLLSVYVPATYENMIEPSKQGNSYRISRGKPLRTSGSRPPVPPPLA